VCEQILIENDKSTRVVMLRTGTKNVHTRSTKHKAMEAMGVGTVEVGEQINR
jgi:hypothetical protein